MESSFKLVLLGTGGPRLTPVPPRGGSSQLIIAGDDCILIDCGPEATLKFVDDLFRIIYSLCHVSPFS